MLLFVLFVVFGVVFCIDCIAVYVVDVDDNGVCVSVGVCAGAVVYVCSTWSCRLL